MCRIWDVGVRSLDTLLLVGGARLVFFYWSSVGGDVLYSKLAFIPIIFFKPKTAEFAHPPSPPYVGFCEVGPMKLNHGLKVPFDFRRLP